MNFPEFLFPNLMSDPSSQLPATRIPTTLPNDGQPWPSSQYLTLRRLSSLDSGGTAGVLEL